jgi:hypothetical protein
MSPELQILAINGTALAVGHLAIYPGLVRHDGSRAGRRAALNRLVWADTGVGLAALVTAGALFWGSGITFSLILFPVNWFWFALLTLLALNLPLVILFLRRHGVSFDP